MNDVIALLPDLEISDISRELIERKPATVSCRSLLAICFRLAIILLGLWTYASHEVGRAAFAQDSANGSSVLVDIGGSTLRVPEKYFLGTKPSTREAQGIYISALMPNMDPMREDNKNEFLYRRGFGRTVGIAINDSKRQTSLLFRLGATRKLGAPYVQHEDQYGLHVYIPAESETANKGTLRQELYVAEDSATISTFIACAREGIVPSPTCIEEFVYRDFLVQLAFNKLRLSDWYTIEQEAKSLVDRFLEPS
jgi:hypothetical protein